MIVRYQELSVQELLNERSAIDAEFARRGISGAIGDIGERLAIEHFAGRPDLTVLTAAARGTKNIDAISRDGERYSIKTLMKANKTGTVYPSEQDDGRAMFEYMLIVLLSEKYELQKIYRISWAQFLTLRSWDRRMNAWYLARSKRVFNSVEDLT